MTKPAEFLIAGAGIAGLASALALARRGHRIRVFEQAQNIEEIGAGIQVGPNAAHALMHLGVWDEFAPATFSPPRISIMDGISGRTLRSIDLADFSRNFGAPYRVAHRADLLSVLHHQALACDAIEIITGVRLESYRLAADVVTCSLSDRSHASADALIAAEGIHSTVRQQMHGTSQPRFIGHLIHRALLPVAQVPAMEDLASVCLWLCPHGHVVHYPVRSGDMLNIVAAVDSPAIATDWNTPATGAQVLEGFRGNAQSLIELLATSPSWQKWAAADHLGTSRWSDGPVALTGDAAHASLPYLAQGAAMALEDAVVLGQCCSPGRDTASALSDFEARRRERTHRVAQVSRRLGRAYHLSGLVAILRNMAISRLPNLTNPVRQDWIYDWRP